MSKFTVGDRVKVKANKIAGDQGDVIKEDGIYVIEEVVDFPAFIALRLGGLSNFYNELYFELVDKKFTINAGDYIENSEFTQEERERFCEIAVECGFKESCVFDFEDLFLGVSWRSNSINTFPVMSSLTQNITTKFREFLDREKGMSKFTKDGFKDGQRVYLEDGAKTNYGNNISGGDAFYVCGEEAVLPLSDGRYISLALHELSDDMKTPSGQRVMLIVDRDGTVLFERGPEEKVKLELEVTPEQAKAIKEQLSGWEE